MNSAGAVDIFGARDETRWIGHQAAHACPGDETNTFFLCFGPMGKVDRAFGAFDATPHASGALSARAQRTIWPCRDRVWSRPPMPAELIVCFCNAPAHRRERRRRERQCL